MKKVLEALTLVKLTAREFGQHIKTIITAKVTAADKVCLRS
jgi:hypothetical protein